MILLTVQDLKGLEDLWDQYTKIKLEKGEICIATMTQDAERVTHKCLASLISSGGALLLATRLPHAVRYTLYKSRQSVLAQLAAYYQQLRAATAWGTQTHSHPVGVDTADTMELCSIAESVELFAEYNAADVQRKEYNSFVGESHCSVDLDINHPARDVSATTAQCTVG